MDTGKPPEGCTSALSANQATEGISQGADQRASTADMSHMEETKAGAGSLTPRGQSAEKTAGQIMEEGKEEPLIMSEQKEGDKNQDGEMVHQKIGNVKAMGSLGSM